MNITRQEEYNNGSTGPFYPATVGTSATGPASWRPVVEICLTDQTTYLRETSLLYSAFESWLVAEHFKRGFDADWLGSVFSQAVFLGNGLMAILAGLFAQTVVDLFGPIAPFDAAAVVLLAGGLVIATTWGENYGGASGGEEKSDGHDHMGQLSKAFRLIRNDKKIFLLGLMQSLFEGSMYCFVFSWTPALSHVADIPHGMIFACFMVSCMVGSALAGTLLQEGSTHRPEKYMQSVFQAAAACLFVPVIVSRLGLADGVQLSDDDQMPPGIKISLLAFCAFECLVGVFWPSMMSLRSRYVPENIRSTIINCFRIPLNFFVCLVLSNVSLMPLSAVFSMCSLFLVLATLCMVKFEAAVNEVQVVSVGGTVTASAAK